MVERLEMLRDICSYGVFLRIRAQRDQCLGGTSRRTENIGIGCYIGGVGIFSLRYTVSTVLRLDEKLLWSAEGSEGRTT